MSHFQAPALPRCSNLEEGLLRIATYWWGGKRCVGRLSADGRDVQPLAVGPLAERRGALALIEAMAAAEAPPRAAGPKLPLSAIRLDAPIPLPRRNIFCSGVNYRAHAAEWRQGGFDAAPGAQDVPEEPVIFSKVPDCVIGPGAPIRIPEASSAIDYEAELAVVIGKPGVRIGFNPPKYLRRGDRVQVEIDGIGILENPVQ